MNEDLIIVIGTMCLIAWLFWLIYRRYERTAQISAQRIEVFGRLLDRFGTAQEVMDFASSEHGRRLFESGATEPARPMMRSIRMVQAGVIITMLSSVFFINAYTGQRYDHDSFIFGLFCLALGVGLFLATWISIHLAKKWGIIGDERSFVAGEER